MLLDQGSSQAAVLSGVFRAGHVAACCCAPQVTSTTSTTPLGLTRGFHTARQCRWVPLTASGWAVAPHYVGSLSTRVIYLLFTQTVDLIDTACCCSCTCCRACTQHLLAPTLVVLWWGVLAIMQLAVCCGTWGCSPGGQLLDIVVDCVWFAMMCR
jgi:hypothetical protein